jgi:hypothetical protein
MSSLISKWRVVKMSPQGITTITPTNYRGDGAIFEI